MASAFTAAILLPGIPANSAPASPTALRDKPCQDVQKLTACINRVTKDKQRERVHEMPQ